MTRTQTITIYQFDELSDNVKETARNWYRQGNLDYEWWDCTFEDAKTCAKILGINIDNIYFSGFASQGDGACFEGSYEFTKGAIAAIKQHAPQDETLYQIATDLQAIQRPSFYQLSASVKHSSRYSHANCTNINVYDNRDGEYVSADTHDALTEALRDFMHWIYRQLETEYHWLNADEQVDESIRCNQYEFGEDGNII